MAEEKSYIERLEEKINMMRIEMTQYVNDLQMWKTCHASEYPARRLQEVMKKIEEINNV